MFMRMTHAWAEIPFEIKRFTACFLQVYAPILIASLTRFTSWNQLLFGSLLGAAVATTLFTIVRAFLPKSGKSTTVRRA